jgi:hypothetical protein
VEVDEEDFFHLLDLSVLNSFIPLTPRDSEFSHRHFRLVLVRDLIQEGEGHFNHRQPHREDRHLPLAK